MCVAITTIATSTGCLQTATAAVLLGDSSFVPATRAYYYEYYKYYYYYYY